MPTVMIADFSGMAPLRDPLLLPDNNAQYADNCWLYRGQVRGFRTENYIYSVTYDDTQSVYRIPIDPQAPPDFTTVGSYWLEFPDPYMAVIRNPTVGDTFNRYYFFPSDQYASGGTNPQWPVTSPGPVFGQLADIVAGHPLLKLGVTAPVTPPTVTAPPLQVFLNTNADSAAGASTLSFADTSTIRVGMLASDVTDRRATASPNLAAAAGTNIIPMSSTTGIFAGMTIKNVYTPAAVFAGTVVTAVNASQVYMSTMFTVAITTGDVFQFDNANAIPSGTTVKSVDSGAQITLSNPIVMAKVYNGDEIQFDTDVAETRAYVYTYVTNYSEEGQPSPATVNTGDTTGTWIITVPPPPAGYVANYNLATVRLYRTVTDSSGGATYYQVDEKPITGSTITFTDDVDTGTITGNKVLDSVGYSPPPAGLQGVVMMANGIAAGFTNEREVWFSAAYLPHAWPASYALTVDYPIVGLTANGTSLNIMTEGSPFIATGVTPDTMTIGKITANDPCIGRGSIVSAGEGAYYASPNGIQLLNTGGTTNITQGIYEKEFHYTLTPQNWTSGKYGLTYAAFIKGPPPNGHGGFVLDQTDSNVPFSYMHFNANVLNSYSDELSGQLFILRQDGTVVQWNPPIPVPDVSTLLAWTWKTKQFRFTTPQQFKAFMVLFEVPPEVRINLGARNTDQGQVFNPNTQYLIIRVWADGRPVVVREIQNSGEVLLIPGGFKAEIWEFQFEGQIGMKFFKVSSSVKELRAT